MSGTLRSPPPLPPPLFSRLSFFRKLCILTLYKLLFALPLPSSPLLYGLCWLVWPVPHGILLFSVHPRLLDVGIVDFNGLDFKFTGTHPWTFPPVRIYLFLSKLVQTFHFPSELCCPALDHAQVHVPSIPIYTDLSKSNEGVGCAAFPDFDVFISSCSCFNLYNGIMSYIPRPFSYFFPRQ